MIPKDKIEEAFKKYIGQRQNYDCKKSFEAGVEFADKQYENIVSELIIENQGLKLYKDNNENLAIEFAEWHALNSEPFIDENKVQSWTLNNKVGFLSSKELFQQFIKERNDNKGN